MDRFTQGALFHSFFLTGAGLALALQGTKSNEPA
jgi:hypothetical protein